MNEQRQQQQQQILEDSLEPQSESKAFLAQAIEEKRRRVRESGITYYTPQEQQYPFHKSSKRIRLVLGGNRSGKSVGGATEAVWYSTGSHPYKLIPTPNYGRIVCTDFTNGIEKVILPEIKKWLPKNALMPGKAGYNAEARTLYLRNGSTIEFMSYDQDDEKFESASRDWIWFDEEPPMSIYKACRVRLLDRKGDMWITMTPLKGMTWVYSELYEQQGINPSLGVFVYDIYANPYLDRAEIDELARGLSEADKEARLHGKFVQASGLIYKEYNTNIHKIPRFIIPRSYPRLCAIDPHPRLPTAVLYMAVIPTKNFIELCKENKIELQGKIRRDIRDIYVVYDEIYPSEPKLISQMVNLMEAHEKGENIGYRLIDNSANTPDPIVGTTIRQEFEKFGIRTVLADKDVANRIFRVRERLQSNTLYFFNDLQNVDWEIRHYAWDDYKIGRDFKDPKEKPRKKRDHLMDCLGYMVISNPSSEPVEVYYPNRDSVCSYTGY